MPRSPVAAGGLGERSESSMGINGGFFPQPSPETRGFPPFWTLRRARQYALGALSPPRPITRADSLYKIRREGRSAVRVEDHSL